MFKGCNFKLRFSGDMRMSHALTYFEHSDVHEFYVCMKYEINKYPEIFT